MNAPIMRQISLGTNYQPLVASSLVGTFTITASNATISLLGDDGQAVPLNKNQSFTLRGVNLADIQAKGSIGDHITVIGATRTL